MNAILKHKIGDSDILEHLSDYLMIYWMEILI